MTTMKKCGMVALLLTTALAMPALGQSTQPDNTGGNNAANGGNGNNGGQNGGGGGGGGGGRRFDPAQMQQRMLDRLKDALGAKDDEFAVLQPKILNVLKLSRDIGGLNFRALFGRGGGGGGGGGRGGGGGGFGNFGGDQTPSAVQQALTDLQSTLDKQDASADEIKTKLAVVREARAKARSDYSAAQQDLKSLLTQKQEAILVEYGMLD